MPAPSEVGALVLPFAEVSAADVARVGGKNASLGEMRRELADEGIPVPDGFATTAEAYRHFVQAHALGPVITREIAAMHAGTRTLRAVGAAIRESFLAGTLRRTFATRSSTSIALWPRGPAPTAWRSRCGRVRPPRTCRRRVSPGSRRHTST